MGTAVRRATRRHLFVLDRSLADPYEDYRRARLGLPPRQWCGRCGLPGQPGDARHYSTAVVGQWRARDAARLGERVEV